MRPRLWLIVILGSTLLLSRATAQEPAPAPADFPSHTLGRLVDAAERITLFQVAQVDPIKGTITWTKVADLKGHEPATTRVDEFGDNISPSLRRNVLGWAAPGKLAVAFDLVSGAPRICLGNSWYMGTQEYSDLRGRYVGPIPKLVEHLQAILAGEEVVVTVAAPTRPGLFDDEPTPIVRDALRGKKGRVCRVRASLKLVDEKSIAACRGYFIGWGVGRAEAVPGLVAALSSKEAWERAEVAEDLGQIGAAARAAMPALRAALRDEDGIVRIFAAEALARIDPGNKDAPTALIAALKDKRNGVCTAAATALLALEFEGRRAIEPLTLALEKADDPTTRSVIAFVLGRLAPEVELGLRRKAVAALRRALRKDRETEVRLWAARALVKFGPDAQAALPDLRAALKDESEEVAKAAVNVLSRLGHEGSVALVEAFIDHGCKVRPSIASVLGNLGPGTPHVVPALKKALDDEDPQIRLSAVGLLLAIDRPTAVRLGVPILNRMLADEDWQIRARACQRLAEFGPDAALAVPALIELLKSNKEGYNPAASTLGHMGSAAQSAIPILIEQLESGDIGKQDAAADALAQLGLIARDALPALRNRLAQTNKAARRAKLAVDLGRIGDIREAVAVLAEVALEQANSNDTYLVRLRALQALGMMGPKAAAALPALRKALRDKTNQSHPEIAMAICRIGRRMERRGLVLDEQYDGIEAIAELIREGDRETQMLWILNELGSDAAPLVPTLVAMLRDKPSETRRWYLIAALGTIGSTAVEASPVLAELLKDSHRDGEQILIATTLGYLRRPRLAASILPMLRDQALHHSGPETRYSYEDPFYCLCILGQEAKPAVPELLQLMRHDDYDRYLRAANALVAIDPQAAAKAGVYDSPRCYASPR